MAHECTKENFLGQVEMFIKDFKGMKTFAASVVIAIIIQIVSFSVLWGKITEKVYNNEKTIVKLYDKLNDIKIIGYAVAGDESLK